VRGGLLGNVIGAVAGGVMGAQIDRHGEGFISAGAALGVLAGSVCGSALGVHLAAGGKGNFSRALLGGLIGEVAAIGVSAILGSGDMLGVFALIPYAVLPPAGAAIMYGRSWGSLDRRAGGGLVNLTAGRLALGIPDVQVQPLLSPGLSARPVLRCNVRILSAEL
jgi:hypothetical protein